MDLIINRLDEIERTVMDELKDFQQATVERIDHLFRKGQKRILVSDEVGLGKTLVARGTIAKFAKLRYEEGDDLVKVVYICSNATIAEQNLDKLRIVNEIKPENSHTSRLSMQHLNIFRQEHDVNVLNRYIQLIPLTPETSFKVTNSQGTVNERALMFAVLRRVPRLRYYSKPLEKIFRFDVRYWTNPRDDWEEQVRLCNVETDGKYESYMVDELLKYGDDIEELVELCRDVKRNGLDKRKAKPHIVRFRMIFADISLNRLEPDLIIMDEFQRFKYLLSSDEDSDMSMLVSKFFNTSGMRILMLSATPYKMYSTLDEIDEEQIDAHYKEFFDVIDFLNVHVREKVKFRQVWNSYSIRLKEFNHDSDSFILAKNQAENAMFKNICRTERISERNLADFVDGSDVSNQLRILEEDITSYLDAQRLLDDIGISVNVPMDYIKSTPYLMSFMKHYQLKRKIERYFIKNPAEINRMRKDTFWLSENDINRYKKISPNNARLNDLMNHALEGNASNLLWLPPSLPYYELGGAFKNSRNATKTLIFSSWEMVPRMISSLVSYEVERQTVGQLNRPIEYFAERRYPSPRMRFALKEGVPTQLSLFTLIYPSIFLVNAYSPIGCLNDKLSLDEIEKDVKEKIAGRLKELPCEDTVREDLRWYHLAPLLLDGRAHVERWFSEVERLIDSGYFFRKGFLNHYWTLKEQYHEFHLNTEGIGRKPDDLEDVLCDMAIAAPGVCVYRSYEKELPEGSSMDKNIVCPTQIGRKFIDRMNLPESIAVIDLNFQSNSEDAYWKNVLKYSKDGNLQSVFDEYVHLLSNGLDSENEDRIGIINEKLLTSFEFRTTSYDIDTFSSFKSRIRTGDKATPSMRTHFAVSFTKGKSDEADTNRKKSVRDAFNSPFRPFVLASTSIGQEGLDFHNYCRRIVHWNLPSNPIDLEQREGRINRFECLAIRQNVAKRYGRIHFNSDNVWRELFMEARRCEKTESCSDLIPYWGLKESEDMVKIERIVPMYPFSRDEIKYKRLIKILSLYRLTLGQARQEELLELIFKRFNFNGDLNDLFINLSPYYKTDVEDFEIESDEDAGEAPASNVNKPVIEDNSIYSESRRLNLPIKLIYCKSTISDRINEGVHININLNDYWSKLKERIVQNNYLDNNLYKFHSQIYWIQIQDVILDFARIEMLVHNEFIEVKLYSPNIIQEKLYKHLLRHKDEIEEELGFKLFFHKSSTWKISVFTPIDVNNKDNWDDAINWHIFMAKRFNEVFSDRVRKFYPKHPVIEPKQLRSRYWVEANKRLTVFNLVSNEMPHPQPWYCIFLDEVPFSECRIELHAYTHKRQIKTSIIIERSRQDLFDYLFENKSVIEDELCFELEWVKVKGRRHIRMTHKIDVRDKSNWSEAIDWQLKKASEFKETFNPKIKEFYDKLNIEK